jgi:hypothetical protein
MFIVFKGRYQLNQSQSRSVENSTEFNIYCVQRNISLAQLPTQLSTIFIGMITYVMCYMISMKLIIFKAEQQNIQRNHYERG